MQKYLFIAIGGGLGSILRYWVATTIGQRVGFRFPYGTLLVNITACLLIGFSISFFDRRPDISQAARLLILVGFIGAYSTFSTFEWESLSLLRSSAVLLAIAYAGLSVMLGLLAAWAGTALGEMI